MTEQRKTELSVIANKIRLLAIEGIYNAKSGHPGGSLSCSDLLAYLYNQEMNVDINTPNEPNRDRLVMSKGHAAPSYYAALALKGFFPVEECKKLRTIGAMLQGHPDMNKIPGVDMSSGSLGQGISAAGGMAYAGKLDKRNYRVYAILGDGELAEGQVWEQAMFASHYKLDNFTIFIDNNGLQIDGNIADVMNSNPIDEKFKAFGWYVITIDGHNFDDIEKAINEAKTIKGKPTAIIMKTIKGKNVSYMENEAGWHGNAPKEEQFQIAKTELEKLIKDGEAKLQ